jgi:hypothetical protein
MTRTQLQMFFMRYNEAIGNIEQAKKRGKPVSEDDLAFLQGASITIGLALESTAPLSRRSDVQEFGLPG